MSGLVSGEDGMVVSGDKVLSDRHHEIKEEAVAALTMLGFPPAPSQKVVLAILKEDADATVEQVIKLALKRL